MTWLSWSYSYLFRLPVGISITTSMAVAEESFMRDPESEQRETTYAPTVSARSGRRPRVSARDRRSTGHARSGCPGSLNGHAHAGRTPHPRVMACFEDAKSQDQSCAHRRNPRRSHGCDGAYLARHSQPAGRPDSRKQE